MKKTLVLMMAAFALTMAFTSCEKEGQYAPKQKISEIKHSRTYKTPLGTEISRTEREVWNWNGKLLSYIDYYDANDNRTTTLFRYDEDNRIVEINYGNSTAKFTYDNNLIQKIELTSESAPMIAKNELEHKGKTVTAIDMTFSAKGTSVTSLPFNPLRLFVPESAANKLLECSQAKGNTRATFTWTGNNLTEMNTSGEYNLSYKYTYDDKNNPYKGLFDVTTLGMDEMFSANNVVREEITEGGSTKAVNYSYVYDNKKCPVKLTWESKMYLVEALMELPVTCVDEYQYQ